MRSFAILVVGFALAACPSSGTKDDTTTVPPPGTSDEPLASEPTGERPMMSVEECEVQGTVVGDIGDGAVYHPDYTCPNGEAPIGTVPSGIEGAVCCPNGGGGAEPAASECAGDGWPQPTDGMDDACQAVHAGCCYPNEAAACAAAGCDVDACTVMESFPAQVACE